MRTIGRSTQGVKVMDLEGEDTLVAMAKVVEREVEGEDVGGAEPAAGAGGTEESSALGDAEIPEDAGDVEAPDDDVASPATNPIN